ncbi:MAG TPA: histidinol-phosphate transaminase [Candidatus Limnocylindrales bacterium]|nr:histidinol-phosphate transaminase [Candidatus Limnocylindrales bacterium]
MSEAARPLAAPRSSDAPLPGGTDWLGRFVRPDLWQAHAYDANHHDFAWQHRELARLMSNECPLPPDDVVLEAAASAMREANLYPHSGWELRQALAAFAGVDADSILLGNGSTEVLDVVARTFITPGDEAVIPVPTYAFFETQVRVNGGIPVLVPATPDLGFDVPAILAAITPRTRLIFLCSPNNPIGRSWTDDEVVTVLGAGIPTVIDQAYLECGYGRSFAPLVARYPNLIVTRTMSKAFGLAGIRVGYGIADPAVIDLLLRVRIPFSISLVAIRAALAALSDPEILERRRRYISEERERLFAALQRLPGVVPWPSEGNFITIDVTATGRSSVEYVDDARAEGLLLRRVTAHRLDGQYVRVTIGTREENDRFLAVFTRGVPGAIAEG